MGGGKEGQVMQRGRGKANYATKRGGTSYSKEQGEEWGAQVVQGREGGVNTPAYTPTPAPLLAAAAAVAVPPLRPAQPCIVPLRYDAGARGACPGMVRAPQPEARQVRIVQRREMDLNHKGRGSCGSGGISGSGGRGRVSAAAEGVAASAASSGGDVAVMVGDVAPPRRCRLPHHKPRDGLPWRAHTLHAHTLFHVHIFHVHTIHVHAPHIQKTMHVPNSFTLATAACAPLRQSPRTTCS